MTPEQADVRDLIVAVLVGSPEDQHLRLLRCMLETYRDCLGRSWPHLTEAEIIDNARWLMVAVEARLTEVEASGGGSAGRA